MNARKATGIVVTLSLILFLVPVPSARAQQPQQSPTVQEALADLVKQLQQALQVRDQAIRNLAQRVEALERELTTLRGAATPPKTSESEAAQAPARSAPSEDYDKEERLARAALDRALVARGGILLPAGTLEIEKSASYFNASSDVISIDGFTILPVLVVGDIVSERIRRDILRSAVTARLGLPKDFQLDVRVPYGYEMERTVTADNQERSRTAFGFGDLEVGATRQITKERGGLPDLLAGVRWKSNTGHDPFRLGSSEPALGTGFHSIQGILTAVKASDPLVFFGGLSYTANLPAKKGVRGLDPASPDEVRQGHFDPGDTIGFQLGSAFAVNPEASLSLSWEQRFTRSTLVDGRSLPGSFLTEGTFRVGTSYVYAAGRSVDLGLGIGLTRDVPDFQFSVAFPFRFSLFGRSR